MKIKYTARILLFALLSIAISGCLNNSPKEDAVTLKIVGDGDERSFFFQYGTDFNVKYPNIQLDFVSFQTIEQGQTFEQFIAAQHPDIIIASRIFYPQFSADGMLKALDPLIQKDKYDIATISPAVIDLLRSTDNDTLYGLAPYFRNNAVFYNKDLFKERDIPFPKDGMSWEELLQLAGRFTDEPGIDGLSLNTEPMARSINSLASIFAQMGRAQGLKLGASKPREELLIESNSWRKIAETIVRHHQSGAIYVYSKGITSAPDDAVRQNRFATGKSAMTIGGFSIVPIVDRKLFPLNNVNPINYGIVKAPIDPKRPDVGLGPELGAVLCIYSKADHEDAAWEFVKYLNSESYAKSKSKTSQLLLSRTQQMNEISGQSLEPFYSQHADPDIDLYGGIDPKRFGSILTIIDRNLMAASKKEKTVEEALADAASEGNALIRETALSEENP